MLLGEIFNSLVLVFKGSKIKLLSLIALLVVIIALDFISIGLAIPLVSNMLGGIELPEIFLLDRFDATGLAVVFVSVFLIKAVIQILLNYKLQAYFFDYYTVVSERIFSSALSDSVVWGFSDGSKLARDATSEVEELVKTVYLPSVFFISELIVVVCIILFLFIIDVRLVLLTLLILFVPGFIIWKWISPRMNFYGHESRDTRKLVMEVAMTLTDLSREFKSAKSEDFLKNKALALSKRFSHAGKNYNFLLSIPRQIIDVLALLVLFAIYYASNLLFDDISIGVFAAFAIALIRLLPGLQRTVVYMGQIKFGWRSRELMEHTDDLSSGDSSAWISWVNKNLRLVNEDKYIDIKGAIARGYNIDDVYNIDVKLNIGVNTLNAESGFGKTSLFNTMAYKLYIDNINYYYMVQDSRAFDGTVRDNLLIGREADDEWLISCLNVVNLADSFSSRFGEEFLDAEISTKNDLSGGQEQRLCVARALVERPKILLLDEPFSNVDPATAKSILEHLLEYSKKFRIKIVVVSHAILDSNEVNKINL